MLTNAAQSPVSRSLDVPHPLPVVRPVDAALLYSVLGMATPAMRRTLLVQLIEDFQRLADTLAALVGDDSGALDLQALTRAAHEVKGLSATIGAEALSVQARTLESNVERLSPQALSTLTQVVATQSTRVAHDLLRHLDGLDAV